MILKIFKYIIVITLLNCLFFCNNKSKVGIEGDNNDGNVVNVGDNNVTITEGKQRITDSVDIPGIWNQNKAIKIVLTLLNEKTDSVKNQYSHQILDFYNMDYGDKESIIAVTFSRPRRVLDKYGNDKTGYSCHACGGNMSFIEFGKYLNGWKIEKKYLDKLEDGQWGEPNPDWKLINIGYHKFGFVLHAGGTGQGYSSGYTIIYSIISDEFKEILNLETSFDDSGAKEISEDSYESNIDVKKYGTGFYDLVITTKGIRDGKPFAEENYYKFNGKKYNISNNFK
ncbi:MULTISPECIES: hypothetical protein [unclassified Chryseobacterium]|uniref:hypothetical protein n=1 Tax=unclassified Chryseobacterium TaxID=2593645 RepID=UPI003017FB0F